MTRSSPHPPSQFPSDNSLELNAHVVPLLHLLHHIVVVPVRLIGSARQPFRPQRLRHFLHTHHEDLGHHLALPRSLTFHDLLQCPKSISLEDGFKLADPAVRVK